MALLALASMPSGALADSSTPVGPPKGERFGVTREDVTPQTNDFVQLYLGTRPLAPKAARVSSDGTATLESVVLSAQTTTGTIVTLERVREDGLFYFPHEIVRRYTIRLSATASRKLILGDQGELFVNPDVLGAEQSVLVLLGNRLVPELGPTAPEGGCGMGVGTGSPAELLAVLVVIAWLGKPRRRVVTCTGRMAGKPESARDPNRDSNGG